MVHDLKRLCEDQHLTAHDALSALINLSDSELIIDQVADEDFLVVLFGIIMDPFSILADLGCMLFSNLTKSECVINRSLKFELPARGSSDPTELIATNEEDRIWINSRIKSSPSPLMDFLMEIFARGDQKLLNPNANFDFLSSVWANISSTSSGRDYLLGLGDYPRLPAEAPLSQLLPFTEHSSLIRRGGVISCIKNCCFTTQAHPVLLSTEGFNLLPRLLLPLMGPDPIDEPEDEIDFPIECQMMGKDKTREADANLRLILIESLILLASLASQRQVMRVKKVYRIVQVLHLNEPENHVQEAIERMVNLLMRDEAVHDPINQNHDDDELVEV